MAVISKVDAAAKGAVTSLVAWVDLAITIVEKIAMLGLVLLLLGTVDAQFAIVDLGLPSLAPTSLAWLAVAWALLKGRLRLDKLIGDKV